MERLRLGRREAVLSMVGMLILCSTATADPADFETCLRLPRLCFFEVEGAGTVGRGPCRVVQCDKLYNQGAGRNI